MAFSPDYRTYTGATRAAETAAVLDAGLRAYMLRVYNWMASGLVLTGIVALAISSTSLLDLFYPLVVTPSGRLVHTPTILAWISIFAPLAFVLVLNIGVNRLSASAVQALYWAFCLAMGASMTNLFVIYTGESVARVFFITAGTFAAMSLWGYSTRTDLTKLGSFLIMGLFGIILASLVNIFLGSSGLQFAISVIGVLVFTGLTAYDTQRIKADFVQFSYAYGPNEAAKRSVYDALGLYLNFVNLFQMLLSLLGNRNQ
jgi:FtsH-binding integral membrane protein